MSRDVFRGFSLCVISLVLIVAGQVSAVGIVGQQPTGALSGVTVFGAAGHGWVVGDLGWGLQRPLLHNMIEDYGNIDQLNYFADYLYRCGATVVTMRPVGNQLCEVVLDQDDPEVTYTGEWIPPINSPYIKYYENGETFSDIPWMMAATDSVETAVARYTPTIPESDIYPVYAWTPHDSAHAIQTYRITYAGGINEVKVDHRRIGNGWVWLGNYYFEAGTSGWVEISNESETVGGFVIADAIRFGNGMGDIVGEGATTVSGFPREEEGALYWAWRGAGLDAVGLPHRIWDNYSTDLYNDWSAGRFWACEMNNENVSLNRWEKVYYSIHSNAATGAARGTVALYNDTYPTQYQELYAQIMGNEVEEDLQIQNADLEHDWATRNDTLGGGYDNRYFVDDEFDTTTIEIAFHDNQQDAELLRDPFVRDAVARASVHGIIKFLNSLPGSEVPLLFAPVQPTGLAMFCDPQAGEVTLSWQAPVSGEAYGDPAQGYKLYRSVDGLSFDGGEDLGDITSIVLTEIAERQTRFYRVAAYNAGGESRQTEAISAMWQSGQDQRVLIVNDFDSFSRLGNKKQGIPGIGVIERQIERLQNPLNSIAQYAETLAACGVTFDTCNRSYAASHQSVFGQYELVIWMAGNDASPGFPVDSIDLTSLTTILNGEGRMLLTGSNIVEELDYYGENRILCRGFLRTMIDEVDAGTNGIEPVADTIFDGLQNMTFALDDKPFNVSCADAITPLGDAVALLNYEGGRGVAALANDNGTARFVLMAVPFESINGTESRAAVMQRVLRWLIQWGQPFDADEDGDVDLDDFADFESCFTGPGVETSVRCSLYHDADHDGDVDLEDFGKLQTFVTGDVYVAE